MTKKQLIDIIFASEKRKHVLLMLKDGPQEMEVLLKGLNTNRSALLPQMRILENYYLIFQSGDSYGLTTVGKIVVDEMKPFLDTIESLNKHSHYLSTHNTDPIPDHLFERISEIRDCKIIEPSLVNTYEINKDFLERSQTSASLKFVYTFLHPAFPEVLIDYISRNIDISVIITQELFDKIKSEMPEELQKIKGYDNIRFYIYKNDLNISSLSISDDCFVLRLLLSNNEFSSKHVYCCCPEACEWSKDLFDHFMEDSVQITDI